MKEKEEDIQLIQNIINGDDNAEKILYDKYRTIVGNFIKNKYPKNKYVEDDVSEIIIKVFINLKNYDSTKCQFKSWVLSITKNYMIDKWRSNVEKLSLLNHANYSVSMSENPGIISYSSYTCSNPTHSFETENTINFLSTQISSCDYTLLDMKYIQGYNYNEIGQEFNLSSNTVSNKVNYIKNKLKKKFLDGYLE